MTTNLPLTPQPSLYAHKPQQASSVPEVCFGLLCSTHGTCQRYENVNGSDPEGARMNSCGVGEDRPHYVQLVPRRTAK